MTFAFTFPGQGSQAVGMGRDLADRFPAARAVFERVDAALDERLSDVIWNGPSDLLTLTRNTQPALMAVSMAVLAVLEDEYGPGSGLLPSFVAGHSLGEYTALAASGALTIEDAARLLRIRGLAMQEAVAAGQGAMLALLGADMNAAARLAEAASDGEVCEVANDNAPGQAVISGSAAAIARAAALAPGFGVRRTVPLNVSAPFHCALMQPAAGRMREALAQIAMAAPRCPLISNVTAEPVSGPDTIKTLLVKQITGVVRWRESVAYMANSGVKTVFEIGSGRVLSGLARRIDSALDARNVETAGDIAAFGEWLEGRATA